MMIDNDTRQAQQLSAALAKLLRLTYEMGRDEALAGESCSRDFAKDAEKFAINRQKQSEQVDMINLVLDGRMMSK